MSQPVTPAPPIIMDVAVSLTAIVRPEPEAHARHDVGELELRCRPRRLRRGWSRRLPRGGAPEGAPGDERRREQGEEDRERAGRRCRGISTGHRSMLSTQGREVRGHRRLQPAAEVRSSPPARTRSSKGLLGNARAYVERYVRCRPCPPAGGVMSFENRAR